MKCAHNNPVPPRSWGDYFDTHVFPRRGKQGNVRFTSGGASAMCKFVMIFKSLTQRKHL